jgi:hypothetical protein
MVALVTGGTFPPGFTVRVYAWLPVRPLILPSLAVIVNEEDPAVVGVPLSAPVLAFNVSPDGRAPELTAKV